MPKTYKLAWVLDDSAAQAAFKRSLKSLDDVEKRALKAATAIEKVFASAGKGAERAAGAAKQAWEATGRASERAAKQAAAGAAAADKFRTAWEKAADSAARSLPALSAPVARLALESGKVGEALAMGFTRGGDVAAKALPPARMQITRSRMEAIDFGRALDHAGRSGSTSLAKLPPIVTRFSRETVTAEEKVRGLDEATASAGKSAGGFVGKLLLLEGARKGITMVLDESQKLEEFWQKLAKEATDFRDTLAELASLRGQPGPNGEVAADVLDVANRTRMTPDKARDYLMSYENIGPTVRAKGHYAPAAGTPEQLEKDVLGDTGRTARRLGIGGTAAGEALGTAGMFHTFRTREDAAEQVGGALKGLSEGKLSYDKGVTALNKGAAKLLDPSEAAAEGAKAGKLRSYSEAGIYMGALSLGTGTADQAQHRMVQNSRLLNPDADNEEGRKALEKAGLTAEMSDPEKLIQLNRYLKANNVTNVRDWLTKNKLGTVATREGMEASLKVSDVLEQRLGAARESAKTNATGRAMLAANEAPPDRMATAADLATKTDIVNKAEGMAGPEEFEKAKQAAALRLRLRAPNYYHGLARRVFNTAISPLTYLTSGVGGEGYEAESGAHTVGPGYAGAIPTIEAEGKRVGVDVMKLFPDLGSSRYESRAKAYTQAAEAVRKRGGDPLRLGDLDKGTRAQIEGVRTGVPPGGPPADMREVERLLKDMLNLMRGQAGPTLPTPSMIPVVFGGGVPLR